MNQQNTPPVTHAETAWLTSLPATMLMAICLLLIIIVLTSQTGRLVQLLFSFRRSRTQRQLIETALVYDFRPISETALALLLLASAVSAALVGVIVWTNLIAAITLSIGICSVIVVGALFIAEQRYIAALDQALTPAIGRLLVQMRSGQGFQIAFSAVTDDLSPGPLRQEWIWIKEKIGTRLSSGAMCLAHTACLAMAMQTPSSRHAAFLSLLESALQQPFSEQVARIDAAYQALSEGIRRTSMIRAELSQMRNTGFALFGINVFITGYMALVQFDRFVTAYTSPLGLPVAIAFVLVAATPLVAGQLLAQFDDIVY